MPSADGSTPWKRALLEIAAGIAIVALTTAVFFGSPQSRLRAYVGLIGFVGIVFSTIGVHRVLWSGPRRESRVPKAWRSLLSFLLAYAGLFVLVSVGMVAAGFAGHRGPRPHVRIHADPDYGFSFAYPEGWNVQVSEADGGRRLTVEPAGRDPSLAGARCVMTVERKARKAEYTQDQLNASVSQAPMRVGDWMVRLRDSDPGDPQVTEARLESLFGNPAHYAIIDRANRRNGIDFFARQERYRTFTPHMNWELACEVERHPTSEPNFASDTRAVRSLIRSMKLDPGTAH